MTFDAGPATRSSSGPLRQAVGGVALALAAALTMWGPDTRAQDSAACARDLADLERVSEAVVLASSTKREVEILLHAAKSDCEAGRSEEARTQLGEAWAQMLSDASLLAPTVSKVASDPCSDGLGAIEQQAAVSEAGAIAQQTAGNLLAEARQLCRAGAEMDAEEKLSMAWAMLVTNGRPGTSSD